MNKGALDFLVLIFIFIGLQFWWIIPIMKRNNRINNEKDNFNKKVNFLEKIYKK
tara:strand:- start:430 stop:591 length:162 start_codon:yes stop_codon:yes gene_type:complete